MSEGINPRAVEDATRALGELLRMARFCAQVEQVFHKAKGKGVGPKKVGTGAYIIKLHEGGIIRVGGQAEADATAANINKQLLLLVRKLYEPQITHFKSRIQAAIFPSLTALRDYSIALNHFNNATKFAVRSVAIDANTHGVMAEPCSLYVEGDGAEDRSNGFVQDVNEMLKPYLKEAEMRLIEELKKAAVLI